MVVRVLCLASACTSEREQAAQRVADIQKNASDAADATRQLADDASKTTNKVVDASKKAARTTQDAARKGKEIVDSAEAAWARVPGSGQLSQTARAWLAEASKPSSIEAVIRRGQQIAPVAAEIGSSVHGAVESDATIEPIYQRVEDGRSERLDAALSDMPRTEVIDGLKIGFKQLDELSNGNSLKERGYLVTWRDGEHLYGFVYRSRRKIDIEALVKDAPRLLRLTKTVVASD